jgi:glutamyl-tRNA reductase
MIHTIVVGTDFRNASVDIREKIHFDDERIRLFLSLLLENSLIKEAVVLSTCNRMEVYAATEEVDDASLFLIHTLANFHQVEAMMLDQIMYHYHCEEAVEHLFKVVSGVESMIVGENEILGQVKNAYMFSSGLGGTKRVLKRLFEKALQIGKYARSRTAINEGSCSVSSVSFDIMKDKTDQNQSKRVLVLGTSKMGIGFLEKNKKVHYDVTVANRTLEKAIKIGDDYQCKVIPFSEVTDRINEFDIVYSATGSRSYIMTNQKFQSVNNGKEKLIIDVGVPRNIDPDIGRAKGVTLITIDDLKNLSNENMKKRKQEVGKIQSIIHKGASDFYTWYTEKQDLWMVKSG